MVRQPFLISVVAGLQAAVVGNVFSYAGMEERTERAAIKSDVRYAYVYFLSTPTERLLSADILHSQMISGILLLHAVRPVLELYRGLVHPPVPHVPFLVVFPTL